MKKTILISVVAFMFMVFPSYSQVKQLIHKASVATDKMDYDEAITLYDKALRQEPDNYRANLGKGMVLAEFMERYNQAIPFLEKALSVSPKDTLIHLDNTLGKSYEYIGDYPRAMYYFGRVLALQMEKL